MKTQQQAKDAILRAWPQIKSECLSVLGSELHYQAMIYHAFRDSGGVPLNQLGMNVKMWIENPVSELFRKLNLRKHPDYQGGFEPIPDLVLFSPEIASDWRRRNRENTLQHALALIEVKASERHKSRLRPAEINLDIRKLAAHREEALHRGSEIMAVMLVIDSAPSREEQMRQYALDRAIELSEALGVGFLYISPNNEIFGI